MRKFLLVVAALLLVSSLVIADHLITPTSYSFNDNSSNFYNITVNNTDLTATANITQVNMTLPGNITYTNGSNWTSTNGVFSSSGSTLTWQNSAGMVMNLSMGYFAFNATGLPGTYNITVTTVNSTGFLLRNITVTMNDTTAPTLTYTSPAAGANLSQEYIIFNISAADYSGISNFVLRSYNSTQDLINTTTTTSSNIYLNLSNLSEGSYYYNITVNDTKNNINISATRSLLLDRTAPGVNPSGYDHNKTAMNITITITESGSGVGSTCTSNRGTVSGSGTSQSVYETGLTCGTSYTYNVTCTDRAGNSGNTTTSHSVDGCGSSSSSSGGGDDEAAADGDIWGISYYLTDNQFKNGTSKVLLKYQRMMFKVNKTFHYLGLTKVYSSSAKINVSSDDPQEADIEVGETLKFDVTDDSYYDVSITLNNITNSTKANFTVMSINESMPARTASPRTNTSSDNNITVTTLDEGSGITGAASNSSTFTMLKKTWFWVVIGCVVVTAAVGVWYFMKKRRMKIFGY